jgi:hypothetical protein
MDMTKIGRFSNGKGEWAVPTPYRMKPLLSISCGLEKQHSLEEQSQHAHPSNAQSWLLVQGSIHGLFQESLFPTIV